MKLISVLFFVLCSFAAYALDSITVQSGEMQVTASFSETPKVNMPFDMSFSFADNGKNVEVNGLAVSYTMTNMNMGKFDYAPAISNGAYDVSKLTLPRCMSGNKTWNAAVTFEYGGEKHSTVVSFELE